MKFRAGAIALPGGGGCAREGGGTGGVPGGTRVGPDGGTEPSGARGAPLAGPSGAGGCGPSPGWAVGRIGTGPDWAAGGPTSPAGGVWPAVSGVAARNGEPGGAANDTRSMIPSSGAAELRGDNAGEGGGESGGSGVPPVGTLGGGFGRGAGG